MHLTVALNNQNFTVYPFDEQIGDPEELAEYLSHTQPQLIPYHPETDPREEIAARMAIVEGEDALPYVEWANQCDPYDIAQAAYELNIPVHEIERRYMGRTKPESNFISFGSHYFWRNQ